MGKSDSHNVIFVLKLMHCSTNSGCIFLS